MSRPLKSDAESPQRPRNVATHERLRIAQGIDQCRYRFCGSAVPERDRNITEETGALRAPDRRAAREFTPPRLIHLQQINEPARLRDSVCDKVSLARDLHELRRVPRTHFLTDVAPEDTIPDERP